MSWRIVYISSQAHLSFKNNYLVIRKDDVQQIHLSEISVLLIDNNMSSISVYLLNELIKNKIKVIICNENHNPNIELIPYYCSYETSRMIMKETQWGKDKCSLLWQSIIKYKILYQRNVLNRLNLDISKLSEYAENVDLDDSTNREGHAAKVYFNLLFGNDFSRNDDNNINAYLNYGYTILMSSFNRSLSIHGYITQIGIHHKGPTNPFNLSCDLMEPFRPIIDIEAYINKDIEFNKDKKKEIVNILNKRYRYNKKSIYLSELIDSYVSNILSYFDNNEMRNEWFEYSEE